VSDNKKRYILTARWAVTLTEEEYEACLQESADVREVPKDAEGLSEIDVVLDLVEGFHVGDNTEVVKTIDYVLDTVDHKFWWEH
jgi:hypothetical protein